MMARYQFWFAFRRVSAGPGVAGEAWWFSPLVARALLGAVMMGIGAVGVWVDVKYVGVPGRRMSLASACVFLPSALSAFFGLALACSAWAEVKLHREARRLRRADGREP